MRGRAADAGSAAGAGAMTDHALRRSLATVLTADAAGYSRQMAGDDQAAMAALDATRRVLRRQIEGA